MRQISLAAIPNQSFSVTLDGRRYDLAFKDADGVMVANVARDDVVIATGQRLVAGQPVLPYRWQESGNFVLLTEGDELPDWTLFGSTQFLYFLSADELAEARGNG